MRRHRVLCLHYHALMVAVAQEMDYVCMGVTDHPQYDELMALASELRRNRLR